MKKKKRMECPYNVVVLEQMEDNAFEEGWMAREEEGKFLGMGDIEIGDIRSTLHAAVDHWIAPDGKMNVQTLCQPVTRKDLKKLRIKLLKVLDEFDI